MKRIRAIAVLPTMFTLGNLVCGFFAIVVAARIDKPGFSEPGDVIAGDAWNCMISAWLIFLAIAFDALDGHVARLSRTTSDFGAQLDSLSDLVTFGVAPAFLLVKLCPSFTYFHREAVWIIAASFAACAALRLARFNVETTEDDDHMTFRGLPSPAGGAVIASFAILFYALRKEGSTMRFAAEIDAAMQIFLPFFALAVAGLMVSRIPYPHIANQLVRGQRSFGHVVALVFALAFVMLARGYSVPILCTAFVLSGPLRYFWIEVVRREPQEEPLF